MRHSLYDISYQELATTSLCLPPPSVFQDPVHFAYYSRFLTFVKSRISEKKTRRSDRRRKVLIAAQRLLLYAICLCCQVTASFRRGRRFDLAEVLNHRSNVRYYTQFFLLVKSGFGGDRTAGSIAARTLHRNFNGASDKGYSMHFQIFVKLVLIYTPATFECAGQGHLIRVFQVAAHRQTARQSRHQDSERFDQPL
jgi:hypothetical protein